MSEVRRYPRERFTRSLHRICRRLVEGPQSRSFDVRFMGRQLGTTQVRVRALWVVGSYARGATSCGDLDLVLDVESLGGAMPGDIQVAKAFVGSAPEVVVYLGTPDKNASGVSFSEARLVWSRSQPEWQLHLEAIPVCASAGRFARRSDLLPLTRRQFHCEDERVEELLADRAAGVINWVFVPLHRDVEASPIVPPDLMRQVDLRPNLGKRTREALERYLAITPEWAEERLRGDSREGFFIAGTRIRIGIPHMPAALLSSLNSLEEVFIPHFSARGPNGAWVIRRGPRHPLVVRTQGYQAFALAYSDMAPHIHVTDEWGVQTQRLELYETAQLAEDEAGVWNHDNADDGDPIGVISLRGEALLHAVGVADELVVFPEHGDPCGFALDSFDERRFDSDEWHEKFFAMLSRC